MTDQQNAGDQEQKADQQTADVPVVKPADSKPARDTAEQPKQKWHAKRPNWGGAFQASTLVMAVVVAYIYGQQLQVMNGQLQQMESGSVQTAQLIVNAANQANATRKVADSALKQAGATNRLAGEAKRSADIAQQSLHVQQRAWVSIVSMSVKEPVGVGKKFAATVVIKNSGRSPAIHTTVKITGDYVCGSFPAHPRYDPLNILSDMLIAPDQSVETGKVEQKEAMTDAVFNELKTRSDCNLYVYGQVRYADIFRSLHWRHYCLYWDKTTTNEFVACPAYNDGDEDYPNGKEP